MPKQLISTNEFRGGMNRDRLSSLADFTSYYLARNALLGNRDANGFGLSMEGSNELFASMSDVVGTAYVEERNWTIVFRQDDSLWLLNHADGEFKEIMNAAEFGCSWNFSDCEWIGGNAQFATKGRCNELNVYFTSGFEVYKVNIDLMLDADRKAGLIAELNECLKCGYEDNCEYFKVSKTGCAPIITPIAYNDGGGNVKAGSYIFLIRMMHKDGGESNWFHHSDAVYVGSEHNKAGEESQGYIDVNITGLDCKFAKAELAVIERIGGIVTAKTLNVVNFGNNKFTYRYTGNDGTPISIKDLLIKSNTHIKAKHLIQKDGHMLYYGVKSRRNVNYQPKALGIEVEWVLREFSYSDVKKYNLKGFMGGEAYPIGIVLNFDDGSHSDVFITTPNPISVNADPDQTTDVSENFKETPNDNVNILAQPQGDLTTAQVTSGAELERKRTAKTDSVSDPQRDDVDTIIDDLTGNLDTDMSDDLCREISLREDFLNAACCNCDNNANPQTPTFIPTYVPTYTPAFFEGGSPGQNDGGPCGTGSAEERCEDESADIEQGVGNWLDKVAGSIEDDQDNTPSSTKIYQGAKAITDAVKRRERVERVARQYTIQKDVTYTTFDPEGENDTGPNDTVTFAGPLFDGEGRNITEVDFTEIASGPTMAKAETNITYPCTRDCNGDAMYGAKAGTPVEHHVFPDSSEHPHFVSKAIGVPYGKYFGDSGEESDLYIRLLGIRLKNIQLPTEDELDVPLCPNNPYTIVMVPRTESNKSVLMKGLATGTFQIENNGKSYVQQRYGCNSKETVSYYHDDGSGGRLASGASGDSHTIFSLDALTIRPSVAGNVIKEELRLSGGGERYGLYAKGKAPEDALRGTRVDALGCRQSINLHRWEQTGTEHTMTFRKYARANDTVSPGSGGTRALMQRSQQECVWVGSDMEQLTDASFTGDVLQHNVPIGFANGQYVSIRRELQDQYGNLENMNYIPLLQAGPRHGSEIEGIVGDTYTGLFSFVKTGFVSDKVGSCADGEKFNIPAQVPSKKKERCICDGPEDLIHQENGAWVWTELPEDGDAADPKNWAGTHTIVNSRTQLYLEAYNQPPISDFYYPGTTTTNISYVGQFTTCPWLREKSDFLERQWYPEIKSPDFRFDSGPSIDSEVNGWEDCFLNQFHREIEQPSLFKKILKTIIRTSLNIIFPMIGIDNFFDVANGGAQFVGNLVEFPMLIALWYLLLRVLFTNDFIDKLLGIPQCKDDEAGGFLEGYNRGLFFNFPGYNMDYSEMSDLYTYVGIPEDYNVCDCEDEITDEIYISDKQLLESDFDAYTHVRPLSKIRISASFGKITNMFVQGGQLYAHTTDVIIPIPTNKTLVDSSQGQLIFGESGFLTEPTGALTEGVVEGYAGLRRHNEAINTQYGYFFIDSEADVIYRFSSSGGLEPVSSKGMYNFFKEYLNFCEPTDCIDEKKTGTAYYSLGVDPRFNRLLVTKNEVNSVNSFTLSYDMDEGVWVSFHDYVPRAYIWDRRDMFTLTDDGIYKHNKDFDYRTYYGTQYPFVVEFTTTPRDGQLFTLGSMVLNTEARKRVEGGIVEDLEVTFDKMAFWNTTQGSGTLPVEWASDDAGQRESARLKATDKLGVFTANKTNRFWHIDKLYDFRRKDCAEKPMVIRAGCQPFEEINEGIFDCNSVNKQDYRNRVILDKYAKFRLTYNTDNTTQINVLQAHVFGEHEQING